MVDGPTPDQLAQQLQTFFNDQPAAVLLENGRILFDLRLATATVTTEHGHCVLHVWSEERNCIRHVVNITVRKTGLRLHVLRMGQSKPQTLELQPPAASSALAARLHSHSLYSAAGAAPASIFS